MSDATTTTDVDQEPAADAAPEPAVPEAFLRGKFALYQTPAGGLHLVAHTEQHGELHKEIPPMLVKMLNSGKFARLLGKMPGADAD